MEAIPASSAWRLPRDSENLEEDSGREARHTVTGARTKHGRCTRALLRQLLLAAAELCTLESAVAMANWWRLLWQMDPVLKPLVLKLEPVT